MPIGDRLNYESGQLDQNLKLKLKTQKNVYNIYNLTCPSTNFSYVNTYT